MRPAASTTGISRSWRATSASRRRRVASSVCPATSRRSPIARDGWKPESTSRMWTKLFSNRPAPTSGTVASATPATAERGTHAGVLAAVGGAAALRLERVLRRLRRDAQRGHRAKGEAGQDGDDGCHCQGTPVHVHLMQERNRQHQRGLERGGQQGGRAAPQGKPRNRRAGRLQSAAATPNPSAARAKRQSRIRNSLNLAAVRASSRFDRLAHPIDQHQTDRRPQHHQDQRHRAAHARLECGEGGAEVVVLCLPILRTRVAVPPPPGQSSRPASAGR